MIHTVLNPVDVFNRVTQGLRKSGNLTDRIWLTGAICSLRDAREKAIVTDMDSTLIASMDEVLSALKTVLSYL